MDEITELQEMTDRLLGEAKKKSKKAKNAAKTDVPSVKPDAYSYSEALDFSAPLGALNLYRSQGQVNWGPHTGVGPYIDDNPHRIEPNSLQGAWQKLHRTLIPESAGAWRKLGSLLESGSACEDMDETVGIDEKHVGFKKLSHQLAHKKGVKDPKALAAAIGRKKYGDAGMAKKAAAGRK